MDPTSLIASIVTIIGAGGTVGKGLRKLAQVRHAPQILIQLKEQVSDLHLLIEVTSDLTRKHHTVTAASSDSCALRGLERIKNTTLALERLIVYDLTIIKNSKGLTEIDKLAWVQSQFRVRDLKAQIQADMQYLSTSLNLNVSISLDQIQNSLDQIQNQRASFRAIESARWDLKPLDYRRDVDLLNNSASSDQRSRDLVSSPKTPSRRLESGTASLEGRTTAALVAESLAHRSLRDNLPISTINVPLPQGPVSPFAGIDILLEILEIKDKLSQRLADPKLAGIEDILLEIKDKLSQRLADAKLMKKSTISCSIACRCKCHKGNRLRSPQAVKEIMGSVSVEYSTLSSRLDSCVSPQCKSSLLNASIVFPHWLSRRSIETSVHKTPYSWGPASIRVSIPMICPDSAGIFWAVRTGAYEHVKRLCLSSKASTPHMISDAEGKSVLHVAVESMNIDIIELLCVLRADVAQRDFFGRSSPFTAAWTILYGEPQNVSRGTLKRLRQLFEEKELFRHGLSPPDHLEFTPMHRSLVITSEHNQGNELVYSDLDQGDATERTTLSWVAQQGKEDLLLKLLRCKADPNKRDSSGKSALHWSIAAKNSHCVSSLIDFGADVFAKDKLGSTPIHIAVQGAGDLNTVQTLLSFGADLREKDGQGMLPLHLAAHYDRPSVVSRLIANGASINDTDMTGRTALHIAISLNNYGILRLLLSDASLQHHVRDNFERTILHCAACLGDTSTLKILTAANLKGVFADDKDSTGVTAMQYAQWRVLYNEEWSNSVVEARDLDPLAWYTTFRKLIMKVRGSMADEAFENPADGYACTWESLNNDLATLNMSEEEVISEDPGSEDEWEDASEVPLDK